MQTISTKLDKKTASKFLELCNNEGKCQSEFLRELIEDMIETDDIEEITPNAVSEPTSEPKPTIEIVPELRNPRIE